MPGKAIGMTLDFGYPGTYSRNPDCVIQNRPASGDIPFGAPLILNSDGTFSTFGEDNTANDFVGVACRIVKQQTDYFKEGVEYRNQEPTDAIMRGSVTVKITSGAPTAGSPVFVRVAENTASPDSKVGDFVAAADGTNTIQLSNAVFHTGKVDNNSVAEITVLTRKA